MICETEHRLAAVVARNKNLAKHVTGVVCKHNQMIRLFRDNRQFTCDPHS